MERWKSKLLKVQFTWTKHGISISSLWSLCYSVPLDIILLSKEHNLGITSQSPERSRVQLAWPLTALSQILKGTCRVCMCKIAQTGTKTICTIHSLKNTQKYTQANDNPQLVHCQLMHTGGHTKNTLMKRFITSVNDTARDLSNWAAMTGKDWTATQVKRSHWDPHLDTWTLTYLLPCVLTISDNTFSNATI